MKVWGTKKKSRDKLPEVGNILHMVLVESMGKVERGKERNKESENQERACRNELGKN